MKKLSTVLSAAKHLVLASAMGAVIAAPAMAGSLSGDIVVMHWMGGGDGEVVSKLGEKFEELNPGVNVEMLVTQSQGDPRGGLRTAILGGETIDVLINTWPAFRVELAEADLLEPIDKFWKSEKLSKNLNDSWKELGMADGKQYGVYYLFNNRSGIWINPQHFIQAGIAQPKTWDEFLASFDKLKAAGFKVPVPLPAKVWAHAEWFESLLLRIGGVETSVALAEHKIAWTSPIVKSALMHYIEMINAGSSDTPAASLANDWDGSAQQIFGANIANYALLGGWVGGHSVTNFGVVEGESIDILQFPSLGLGHDDTSSVDALETVVLKASKNKKTAHAFQAFLVSEEAANLLATLNKGSASNMVNSSLYQGAVKTSAAAISKAKVQYVLGDLLPGDLVNEYRIQLQHLIKNPTAATVDKVLAAIEAKAKTSY